MAHRQGAELVVIFLCLRRMNNLFHAHSFKLLKTKNADSIPCLWGWTEFISQSSSLCSLNHAHTVSCLDAKKGAKEILVLPVLSSVQSFLPQQQLRMSGYFFERHLNQFFSLSYQFRWLICKWVSKPNFKWPKNSWMKQVLWIVKSIS